MNISNLSPSRIFALMVASALLGATDHGFGQAAAPASPPAATAAHDAKSELKDLMAKVNDKIEQGQNTEAALAPEIREFDRLLAEHKGEKTDDVAHILLMKAMLYTQVLDNTDKGIALVKELKVEFPNTTPGKKADDILDSLNNMAEAKKIQKQLVEGATFPDFKVTGVDGKALSLADYKGKIVLVDFWATWCPPCRAEVPNVVETYHKYHDKGFEVVGISLDEDKSKLSNFTKENGMVWRQYFDGRGWSNLLAAKYGVMSIPATFLLDGKGKIIAKEARGDALGEAVGKALAVPK